MATEATTTPDFTEQQPLRLVGQAERDGDLFLLFDGELGQHVLHQRTDDAEQWAAFTECSVGSITAREIYEAARPHLDRAANSPTTTDFTEQARQLVDKVACDHGPYSGCFRVHLAELVSAIASFAAEAATQGQAITITRAAKICADEAVRMEKENKERGRYFWPQEAIGTAEALETSHRKYVVVQIDRDIWEKLQKEYRQ